MKKMKMNSKKKVCLLTSVGVLQPQDLEACVLF